MPSLVLSLQVLFPKRYFSYRLRWLTGMCVHVLIFLFAWQLTGLKTEIHRPNHFSKFSHVNSYLAFLDDSKQEKSKSYKTTIRIVAAYSGNVWNKTEGKCLAYFSKDSISDLLHYGDLVIFSTRPDEVKPPANPSQFDYKRWLSLNQVYHQLYLKNSDWKSLGHHYGNPLVETAINMRERLLKIFRDNNISGDDYAVVSALLLGDTDEIDQDIINAYAASGALHVLSVSGLHVGIIYIALNSVLFFMNRNRKTKVLKAGILIMFLWFYALLTGLSPAVLRSAAMLSFIVIGKAFERSTNMYNTLAASAITLFCFQPHLLLQVGFQLSYMAVFGIVFLYKEIHALLFPQKWFWQQVWGLIAVSIAAQIATFPMGLFYFHQFPNYFLFSNMLVIPLSTVIIYGGILLFVISPVTIVAKYVGLLLGQTVHLLNQTVIFIEHLPHSLWQGISINLYETYLLYISIFMLIFFLMKKETNYLTASLIATVVLFTFFIMDNMQWNRQKQLIVYDIPKTSAVNLIDGTSSVLIADSSILQNKSMMMFNIVHYWWDCGFTEEHVESVTNLGESCKLKSGNVFLYNDFLFFDGKKILILNDARILKNNKALPFKPDYIILSGNIKTGLQKIKNKVHFGKLIIDSSNSEKRTGQWLGEAKQLGIDCYSVLQSGAYVEILQ
ncbi:MAG: ComEC/Rec2 family competence protein [Bacteroidetes bacterium]|nr:ComEC/Rec2 family competence protein [Bacteroidota bacterium]